MNTTALACYLTVCETKNFTKAAEICYISPQGVSKAVKNLEEELGCQLFRRTYRGLELTECGAALQRRAQRILEETRLLREDLDRLTEGEGRKICLGIAMGVSQVMGAEFVGRVQEMLASEGLTSVDSVDLMCESEVFGRRYEFAITAGPVDRDKFDAVVLRQGCLCAFVHESHPFYQRDSIGFEDLKGQELITTNQNYRTYHQLDAACRAHGFEPDIIATTITLRDTCRVEPYRRAVGVSSYLILGKVCYEGFRAVPILDSAYGWNLELIAKKGNRRSAKLERVYRKILDCARAQG